MIPGGDALHVSRSCRLYASRVAGGSLANRSFDANTARGGGVSFIKQNDVTVAGSLFMNNRSGVLVDGTEVGVPSDYYYLAGTSTALDLITGSKRCSATRRRVIVDHVPAFAQGVPHSPGDFVARGNGTCVVRDRLTRWAYFVAAPGYGPVREVGIPSSGLYLVVAVMPESPHAPFLIGRLVERTQFNGASVADMIAAARPESSPVGPV